jgi:hypothetical protein
MLRIGSRVFELVRNQSGLHATLDPHAAAHERQQWRIEAHWVPADEDPGADWTDSAGGGWEYGRLAVNPIMGFAVSHWHELDKAVLLDAGGEVTNLGFASWQNLIHLGSGENPVQDVVIGGLRIIQRDGYLLTLEIDGEISPVEDSTVHGDFSAMIELPFATVTVAVPLNAADPLATAQGIARRELGLTTCARSHVRRYDPERPTSLKPHRNSKHRVMLELPWRGESK